jgi:hypothetical protein
MRDTSEGMIEIIDAVKSEEGCFAFISVPKKEQRRAFRFEITIAAYKAVRRILESRPLDRTPGLKYRYFWNGSMGGKTEQKILLGIRCEVGRDGKSIKFEVPHSLAANLKWFNEIETFDEAERFSVKI